MTFFTSNGGLEDRFNSPHSPRISDPPLFNHSSYLRDPFLSQSSTRTTLHNPASAINDSRNLHRRFTTSNYSSLGQQRRSAFEPASGDIFAFQPSISPAEKKKQEYEQLKQKRLERQKRLEFLNQESHREELELARLSQELGMDSNGVGHQSEPTTPPELQDTGFPTPLSRPNRFSAGNLISPPGIFSNHSKGDNHLTSPPTERARAYNALTAAAPSDPHSKNNSDEEDNHDEILDFNHRSAASLNRNSMPVTRRDLGTNGISDSNNNALGHVNTHRFLFGDDDKADHLSTTPRPKSFFHQSDKDDFPILLKRDMSGNMQYSGSNALDLSSAEESEPPSSQASKRSSLHRSFPSSAFAGFGLNSNQVNKSDSPPFNFSQAGTSETFTPTKSNASNRHSLGANTSLSTAPKRPGLLASPPPSTMADVSGSTPKLQSSYSTNDIPTIKNPGGTSSQPQNPNVTAEQRLHNHNASLGRIPPGAMGSSALNSKRQSREMSSSTESPAEDQNAALQSLASVLQSSMGGGQQGNLPTSSSATGESSAFTTQPQLSSMPFTQQGYGSNYGLGDSMNMLNAAMGGLSMGVSSQQWNPAAQQWNTSSPYGQSSYSGYNNYQNYSPSRFTDTQAQRGQRRGGAGGNSGTQGVEDASRYAQFRLEDLAGQIYNLCTDQNGCRFLQKKLEEDNQQYTEMIFDETKDHMVDLMTDPFGNYLCQKLLEHTSNEQHTVLIDNAAVHMVKIALNQHGTRALQKMIEYVVDSQQIDTLIHALEDQVVPMIQDLNGNHVIQKCLNRLAPPNIQFIIDAVSAHCIVVGTHRHGCCVIQRCIDHATPEQKAQLVSAITQCSLPLVQDPFGNYVLQYIFDQGEASFSQLLCRTFLGRIAELSKQKFSSNVIEKCIRIADPEIKHQMIEELINSPEFDRIADDAFANYVVQTAWDNANEEDEARLADKIRPVLPRMRHKPYGRRFQSRINERDKRFGMGAGTTPSELASPESTHLQPNFAAAPGGSGFYNPHDSGYGGGAFGIQSPQFSHSGLAPMSDYARPPSHRLSNPPQPTFPNMGQFGGFGYSSQQFGGFGQGFGRSSGF